jgi:hypothetical protein
MKILKSRVTTGRGDAIVVVLSGNAANVMVMSDSSLRSYQSGGRFDYFGGYFDRSPAIIRPPAGCWNVIVDLGGRAGRVNASIRVIRQAA